MKFLADAAREHMADSFGIGVIGFDKQYFGSGVAHGTDFRASLHHRIHCSGSSRFTTP